jgi:DnaJ-class molecular chaperone
MGFLSTLTATQVGAIATSLAGVTTPPATPPACGSCHAIPPATGKHAFHSTRATCATCHGSGYSTTAVNAATHNNGVKNLTTTIGWNTTTRSCSNSCHGTKAW